MNEHLFIVFHLQGARGMNQFTSDFFTNLQILDPAEGPWLRPLSEGLPPYSERLHNACS